jgi:glycosyltransferase involved in cell wall biosynthesis
VKIGINATIVDSSSSGLGVYTTSIIRELALLHPNITVYTSEPELFSWKGLEVLRVTDAVRASRGIRGHVGRVLWSQSRLPKRLRAAGISVLLSPTPLEALLHSPVPQVIVIHDLLPIRFPESYRRQKYYYRTVVPRLLQRCSRIVAVSHTTKGEIVNAFKINPGQVQVVYNGCDHERFTVGKSADRGFPDGVRKPYILYVGNLFPHKNLQRLLSAFASIKDKIKHQLVIVGYRDPRYYPSLKQAAASHGIGDRVLFLDYMKPDILPTLYRGAHWLVLPSLFEGFGMPPLEAMACGTPVIVSSTPALRETVGEAGLYFDPTDIRDMAERIFSACSNDTQRAELREKGLERAGKFSWSKSAGEILILLKQANEISGSTCLSSDGDSGRADR